MGLNTFKLDKCAMCYLCNEKVEEDIAKHYLFKHQLITIFSPSNSGNYLTCLNKGCNLKRPLFSKSIPLAYSCHFLDQCSGAQPFIEFLDKIKIIKIAVSTMPEIYEINEREVDLEWEKASIDIGNELPGNEGGGTYSGLDEASSSSSNESDGPTWRADVPSDGVDPRYEHIEPDTATDEVR